MGIFGLLIGILPAMVIHYACFVPGKTTINSSCTKSYQQLRSSDGLLHPIHTRSKYCLCRRSPQSLIDFLESSRWSMKMFLSGISFPESSASNSNRSPAVQTPYKDSSKYVSSFPFPAIQTVTEPVKILGSNAHTKIHSYSKGLVCHHLHHMTNE